MSPVMHASRAVLLFAITWTSAMTAQERSTVTRTRYGVLPDGRAVEQFTLANRHGTEVRVIAYGGIITSIRTRDRAGRLDDITLGFDGLDGYLANSPYFGAIVGRYANRIAGGRFTLSGTSYQLARNNGPNSLHGGRHGFDQALWVAEPARSAHGAGVVLRYTSGDGEEGYPGALRARVSYTLTEDDALVVDYEATTDRATPVNLTQHTYWNLHGGGRGTILDHQLSLDASAFTPVDTTLIPTGVVASVIGTPFDFRTPVAIGARIGQDDAQLGAGRGYDHNWVLDGERPGGVNGPAPAGRPPHAARLLDSASGRTLDVFTTEPGIQFYSGNFLAGAITGKGGERYPQRAGLCLETQHFPDSPNHPAFPTTILRPGETWRSRTVFVFGVER